MAFRKNKKPKRLYIPTKRKWHTRKRRNQVPKRLKKQPLKEFKKKIGGIFQSSIHYLLGAIIIGTVVLFLIFSTYFSITDIRVARENLNVNSAAIENELSQYIGKNILFFPRNRIRETIQEQFPEFETIHINKNLPNEIVIELESYPIVANLKAYYQLPEADITVQEFSALNKAIADIEGGDAEGDRAQPEEVFNPLDNPLITESAFRLDESDQEQTTEPEVEVEEQKGLLNEIGQAIFDQDENLELITITVRGLDQPVEDREQVIPHERMDYILDSKSYFENAMSLEVTGIEYKAIARETHLKTSNMSVWLNMERDFEQQINKLASIWEEAELFKEDFAYIDLRVKDKVIYCPKNARCD